MKFIITEEQYEKFLFESERIKLLDEHKKDLEKVLNRFMKQKYDWFEGIEIEYLSFLPDLGYVGIQGIISVDMEWGAKQWREYHYSQYFPGNTYWKTDEVTDSVSFGDIIGSDLGDEIRNLILGYFKLVTGISARTLSWSWLMTKFIEKPEIFDN